VRQIRRVLLPNWQGNHGDGLQAIKNRLVGIGRSGGTLRQGASGSEQNDEQPESTMHVEFTPADFAMRTARLCIGKSKPGGEGTQRKDGDGSVEKGESKKQKRKNKHSIQLSRMLWEQALLRILRLQCHKSNNHLSVTQVT